MDNVVAYFAEVFEFLVAGVVVGLATLLALWTFDPSTLTGFVDSLGRLPDDTGTAIGFVALALVYALGVFAEGVSRLLTEWRLKSLTDKRYENVRLEPEKARQKSSPAERERERRRSWVKHENPRGSAEVDSQLKRLRIERTLLLALAIVTATMLLSGQWLWTLVAVVPTVLTAWLVNERFDRFLGAIDRGHKDLNSPSTEAAMDVGP